MDEASEAPFSPEVVAPPPDGAGDALAAPAPGGVEGGSLVVSVEQAQVRDFMSWGASVLGFDMVAVALLAVLVGCVVARELFGRWR